MEHALFHLAFPVNELSEAKAFYLHILGCTLGRDNQNWCDVHFFGHQITLHQKPDQVIPTEQQGVRHFGAILDWARWALYCKHLQTRGVSFLKPPTVAYEGTPREEGKLLLKDPSGHIIEIKAYRDPSHALQLTTPRSEPPSTQ